MSLVREYLELAGSFFVGINAFLTVTLFPLFQRAIEKHREVVDAAGVISKTTVNNYPKFLDAAYYNVATLVIPVSAFLVWFFFLRNKESWSRCAIAWGFSICWFLIFLKLDAGG